VHSSQLLAKYVVDMGPSATSPESREAALRCVLDLLSAAAAGFHESGTRAVRAMVRSQYGAGPAEIWFTGERASASGALLCNSAAASALDLDDGFRMARGHPGAAAIPSATAALPEAGGSAEGFLAAIVAGYEVGLRVAMGLPGYAPSGAWSPFAAIAAAGRVRNTSADHLAHAFAIAAQCAPSLPGLAGLMGSDVKEGIPWGAATGMAALQLAESGFTGPLAIFDDPPLFANEHIVAGLGGEALIGGTYFKPYACCRHIHAPLDAYAALAERHRLSPSSVESVEVHTYSATFNLSNLPAPRNLVEAQYSVPFCIATLALRGKEALLPMDASAIDDPAVRAFARCVTIHRDATIEPMFPAESPARVVVTSSSGRFESPVTMPRGDPADPLSWSDLQGKFMTATRHALSSVRQRNLLDAVDRLRDGDLRPLRVALGAALGD